MPRRQFTDAEVARILGENTRFKEQLADADRRGRDLSRLAQNEAGARAGVETAGEYTDPHDLLRKGGEWLGAARNWIKWNCHNGDRVTWGSTDLLSPVLTVRDVEELAARAVAADRNARRETAPPPASDRADEIGRAWDAQAAMLSAPPPGDVAALDEQRVAAAWDATRQIGDVWAPWDDLIEHTREHMLAFARALTAPPSHDVRALVAEARACARARRSQAAMLGAPDPAGDRAVAALIERLVGALTAKESARG